MRPLTAAAPCDERRYVRIRDRVEPAGAAEIADEPADIGEGGGAVGVVLAGLVPVALESRLQRQGCFAPEGCGGGALGRDLALRPFALGNLDLLGGALGRGGRADAKSTATTLEVDDVVLAAFRLVDGHSVLLRRAMKAARSSGWNRRRGLFKPAPFRM